MNWKLAAVLLVTVACLAWVLWGIDLQVVRSCLAGFSWWTLLPMLGLYFAAHVVRCFRLRLLLDEPVGFMRLLTVNSIGFLAINVVPLRLGELVRPYLLLEQDGLRFGRSMAAIFMERLLDMLALLLMLLLVGVVADPPPGGVLVAGVDLVAAGMRMAGGVAASGLVFIALLVLLGERLVRLVERAAALVSTELSQKLGSFLRHFQTNVATLARKPLRALVLLTQTAVMWVVTVLGLWMVLLGVEGLQMGPSDALVTWALTLAAMTAVPTPGFLGSHEAGCSAALRLLGLDPSLAATVAVLIHMGQLGFTVGLGLLFMLREGVSLGDLVRRSRALPSEHDQDESGRAQAERRE